MLVLIYTTATAEYVDAKSQDDECKCEVLPTGEKICDPIDCQLTIKLEKHIDYQVIITTIQVMKTRRVRMKSANA